MNALRVRIEHYLTRAEELRAIADSMKVPESRSHVLHMADQYERMAMALQKSEQKSRR